MVNNPNVGDILGVDAFGPCSLEPHHPDLYWYGVHGVEILYTLMGTGCQSVSRIHTEDTDFVMGTWKDGRIGTFRGNRKGAHSYGGMVFGSKSISRSGDYAGYDPLVVEIAKFFRSGKPPVSAETTIEIFAFMEAADESKRQGGKPVTLEQVMEAARKTNAARQASAAGKWKAGLAETIITPEHFMVMGGYAARPLPAIGKLHDLKAKALVLDDAQGQRSVLVTIDLVGIDRETSVDVCQRIEKEYGIPRSGIALSTSHTHCGPAIGRKFAACILPLDAEQQELVKQYDAQLRDRLVEVVGEAIKNLGPPQLSGRHGHGRVCGQPSQQSRARSPQASGRSPTGRTGRLTRCRC